MATKKAAPKKAKARRKATKETTKAAKKQKAAPSKPARAKTPAAKKAPASKPKRTARQAKPPSRPRPRSPQSIAEEVFSRLGLRAARTDGDVVRWDIDVPEDEHFEMVAQMIDSEQVVVYLVFREHVALGRMGDVLEMVARVNHGLLVGAYEVDPDLGYVRLKVALDFKGTVLDPMLFANLLTGASDVSEVYDDAILAVMNGDASPKEAILQVEDAGLGPPASRR